ncbi:hypothetical protein [Mycolicibacterium wolinskyi]|uniref:hypothetical protein n=1 Tax=Mycolicibacterium wolinskyi TaxID=59750 RepID=UPI00391792CA
MQNNETRSNLAPVLRLTALAQGWSAGARQWVKEVSGSGDIFANIHIDNVFIAVLTPVSVLLPSAGGVAVSDR